MIKRNNQTKAIKRGKDLFICIFLTWIVLSSWAYAESGMPTGLLNKLPDEMMSDGYMRVKMAPLKKVKSHAFSRSQTVADWRQAMPIGNGDFGASVHGYPDNLTFHIAKTDVWWDNKETGQGYPSFGFEECRKRLAAGDKASVNEKLRRIKKEEHKGRPNETACARLTIQLCRSGIFYGVRERLDLSTAMASTHFNVGQNGVDGKSFRAESFVSHPAEVMAVRLTPGSKNWGTVRFELSRDPMEIEARPERLKMTVEELDKKYQPKPRVEGGLAWFNMQLNGGDGFVVMLATDARNVEATAVGPDIFGRFRPQDGPITFYLTVVSTHDISGPWAIKNHETSTPLNEARRRIENALKVGYEELRRDHVNWWKQYWRRSWVSMPVKAHEYPWYWSLYKAGSSRRPGKVPPSYAAPWRSGNYANWGFYTFNYEQTHYNLGQLPTNHAELLEPILAVVHNTKEKIRKGTKEFYGLDGICYPHAMSFKGDFIWYRMTVMNISTAGEAVSWAWDYYDFTGDKDFLKNIGYPLLRDVAIFYRGYLQEDEDGRLFIFPSYYSEEIAYFRNTVPDLAMFRLVFRRASQAAEVLGVDADRAKEWRDADARLTPYPTWPDGALKSAETLRPGDRQPRLTTEMFNLYPVTVGDEVDAWHGPEQLRKQIRTTYEKELGHHPAAWDKSLSYIAAARMGDRVYAEKIFNLVTKLSEYGNLIGGGEWNQFLNVGFGVDIGLAFPAGVITEFLLQSQGGDIRLFPAVPLNGDYAFHSLRARGAFLVSSEMRDKQVPYALVQSLAGNLCRIVQPFGKEVEVQVRDLTAGKVVVDTKAQEDQIIEFDTLAKHVYVIQRKEQPLENIPMKE